MHRVAVNGRFSGTPRPTGTQTVAHEIVEHLTALDDRPEVVLVIDPDHPSVPRWRARPGVDVVEVPFGRMGRARAQWYEQSRLHGVARAAGCGMVHHPMNTCPRWPGAMPGLVTLHDLNFHHHPEWYGRAFRTWLEWTMVPGLRRAELVACISRYVAEDAHRTLGIERTRLRHVPNGLKRLAPDEVVAGVRRHDPPVVLAVNPWQPHKNLGRLLAAVERVREEGLDCRVRIAGRPHDNFRDQPGLARAVDAEHVEVLGYLDDPDLAREYAAATVLAMPSLEEGFGLPVIEAMSFGTTVVTSTVASLPEVGGDAAILVDPFDVGAIADGLRRALTEDEADARARRERERRHLLAFDWTAIARTYVDLYREVLRGKERA